MSLIEDLLSVIIVVGSFLVAIGAAILSLILCILIYVIYLACIVGAIGAVLYMVKYLFF